MSDSWETSSVKDDGRYSPDKFYVDSTDRRGHGEDARFKLPPSVMGEVAALIATKQVPYRNNADFYRDSIVHRLQYLSDHIDDPVFKQRVAFITSVAEAEQVRRRQEQEKGTVEVWEKIIGDSTNSERVGHLDMLKQLFRTMQFETYRNQIGDMIRRVEG